MAATARATGIETATNEAEPEWTVETAIDAEHRDPGPDERFEGPRAVVPHARIPLGLWRDVIRLLDGEGRWLSEEDFVQAAVREKVVREIAAAVREKAKEYGVRGSSVRFVSEDGETPGYHY